MGGTYPYPQYVMYPPPGSVFCNKFLTSSNSNHFFIGVQAAMVPLGDKGFYFAPMKLTLNVYTAAGFFGVFMALVNFGAIVIWFREFKVDIYAGQKKIDVDTGEIFLLYFILDTRG